MAGPLEHIIQNVRQWIGLADDDLRVAQIALSVKDDCPYHIVAYHAQQCAEKYLKGYLLLHGVEFPYTHSIAMLRTLCSGVGLAAEVLEEADELTPFAVRTRYPGEHESVTEQDARRATDLADRVRSVVRAELARAGITS